MGMVLKPSERAWRGVQDRVTHWSRRRTGGRRGEGEGGRGKALVSLLLSWTGGYRRGLKEEIDRYNIKINK